MGCKLRFIPFTYTSFSDGRPHLFRGNKEMYLRPSHSFGQPTRITNKSTVTINRNVFEIDNCNYKPDGE